MEEDLIHPRINIFYIKERENDVEKLYLTYSTLGAKVTLLKVENDKYTRKHLGKLYYFDRNPRVAEIAVALAINILKFEKISVQYSEPHQEQTPNYAVWIVGSVESKTRLNAASQITQIKILNEELSKAIVPLTHCPKCNCSVRDDRLKKHLTKAHSNEYQKQQNRIDTPAKHLANKYREEKPHTNSQIPKSRKPSKLAKERRLTILGSKIASKESSATYWNKPVIRGSQFHISSPKSFRSSNIKRCKICEKVALSDTDVCYICNSSTK
jgi:hypothetical protein